MIDLSASFPVLRKPANLSRAVTLMLERFTYGFANAVAKAEAVSLFEEHHLAAPERPLFEVAVANVSWARGTAVDTKNPDRGPLLIVSGGEDHVVPWPVANVADNEQAKNPGVTQIIEIEGVGHPLVIVRSYGT